MIDRVQSLERIIRLVRHASVPGVGLKLSMRLDDADCHIGIGLEPEFAEGLAWED